MVTTDLKKELKHLYSPSTQDVAIVEVPPLNFLMIDGHGDPNTSAAYRDALAALYAVSYTIKFTLKRAQPAADYVVMPLEGLWWAGDMTSFARARKDDWQWTAMIAQPEQVTAAVVDAALAQTATKKDLTALPRLRFAVYAEGLVAQVMHIGPYAAEGPTIERLHRFIADHGYRCAGKHHEIYLGDPRKTAPERLKTVLRQPIAA